MIELTVTCPTCGAVVRQIALAVPSEVTIPCACGMGIDVELVAVPGGGVAIASVRSFDPSSVPGLPGQGKLAE